MKSREQPLANCEINIGGERFREIHLLNAEGLDFGHHQRLPHQSNSDCRVEVIYFVPRRKGFRNPLNYLIIIRGEESQLQEYQII